MRIKVLTQVFPPEIHPTAVMVEQLVSTLASRGHTVHVNAGFPHHPKGIVFDGFKKRALAIECFGGYRVIRGWHLTSQSRSIFVRAAVMISQALSTAITALFAPRSDVVISYGPPLIGPLLAAVVAAIHRAPLVTVIYDLYPDIAVETRAVRSRAVIWAARIVERLVYRASTRIVVLSEGFKRTLVARGVPADSIDIIPVWLEADDIVPADRLNAWRTAHDIPPNVQVVLYAGTVGLVSGAQVVIDAAELFADRPDVLFLFVGEGQLLPELQDLTQRRRLTNVRFLPFQPREDLRFVQGTADVSVVTLAPGRGRTSVPSKVVAYMAAARPVVASVDVDSDTASCVRRAGAGFVVAPADAAGLHRAISQLLSSAHTRAEMGTAGRAYFTEAFAAHAVLDRFSSVIETVAREGR